MGNFFRGALKIAVALVGAIVVLSLLAGLAAYIYQQYQKQQAKPYEEVKHLTYDLKDPIGVELVGRTKLVNDRLYAQMTFKGYPPILSSPENIANPDAGFTIIFVDKDGFAIFEKKVSLRSFLKMQEGGDIKGLAYRWDEYMAKDTYARFDHLYVSWQLAEPERKPAPQKPAKWEDAPIVEDHCAPDLTREERLRRLAKHGKIRQEGSNSFTTGDRRLAYYSTGDLMLCR